MADGEEARDNRRKAPHTKVLSNLKLPEMDWKAQNQVVTWEISEEKLKFLLDGIEIPKEMWYLYILQQCGKEGWG